MKTKKIPIRSCAITKERLPKQELIRIVRTKDLEVLVDETGKLNGKGAYLKKDIKVINKAKKNKVLNKLLDVDINDKVYKKKKKIVNNI